MTTSSLRYPDLGADTRDPLEAIGARTAATTAWRRRVLRVGGLVQVSFAAFFLLQASIAFHGDLRTLLLGALGGCTAGLLAYGAAATVDQAPPPTGLEAAHLQDLVSPAGTTQLVAAAAAPIIATWAGHGDWALPAIAVTIGPFLLWLDHLVDIHHYRRVGWILIVGPVLLAIALDGATLTAALGLAAGTVLLVTAAAGFHQLARSAPGRWDR
jgi:hypothetical protein